MCSFDASDHNPLHFVERDLIAGTVVKLGGFWAFVMGERLGLLDDAAVPEIGGDASYPKLVSAKVPEPADETRRCLTGGFAPSRPTSRAAESG